MAVVPVAKRSRVGAGRISNCWLARPPLRELIKSHNVNRHTSNMLCSLARSCAKALGRDEQAHLHVDVFKHPGECLDMGNVDPPTEALAVHNHAPYVLSLIHISEPTRLGMISYAVFC